MGQNWYDNLFIFATVKTVSNIANANVQLYQKWFIVYGWDKSCLTNVYNRQSFNTKLHKINFENWVITNLAKIKINTHDGGTTLTLNPWDEVKEVILFWYITFYTSDHDLLFLAEDWKWQADDESYDCKFYLPRHHHTCSIQPVLF